MFFDSFNSAPVYPGRMLVAVGALVALAAMLQILL